MAPQNIALMTRTPTHMEGSSNNAMGLRRLGGFLVDLCALRVFKLEFSGRHRKRAIGFAHSAIREPFFVGSVVTPRNGR